MMTAREKWLIDLISHTLQQDLSNATPSTDLFEFGVDSLAMLRIARKIGEQLDAEIELEWLFDHSTIADLAAFFDNRFGFLIA